MGALSIGVQVKASYAHQALRCTPAIEAEVTKELWEIEGILALLDKRSSSRPPLRQV